MEPVRHPQDQPITAELVAEHGLTAEEYTQIEEILGRAPTYTELGVFSALWSEHCGYQNSRPLLREFPTEAPWVLQGPGENAGVIEVGDGWAVAFKIESHNRPSAVEPYHGAGTGVGGILRDVFTMGARPVAVLNSLRFGPLTEPHTRHLFAEAVRGMADYGRGVGVPTVAGEVYFDESYRGNPLVNAMAIGLLRKEELIRGEAEGPGNPIMAVGAPTDRAGIHGATWASAELEEDSGERRSLIPAGNPELERRLMEASLALIRSGHIVGIQDMGAAGVASSSSEMAARSGTGVDIDTALVPTKLPPGAPPMTPYEILLSETQERMLVVAKAGHEEAIRDLLAEWDLEPAVIGQVTDDGFYRVRENGVVYCEIPGQALVDAPTYIRDAEESTAVVELRNWSPESLDTTDTPAPNDALLQLLGTPTIASKRWAYSQFEGADDEAGPVVAGPGSGAGVVQIPGTRIGIAATVDCNGRYCYLDPRRGGMIAVAEAARNLVTRGARPRATTDNLNFGSPLDPAVYYQLRESILGISEACRTFETPVVSGNVSLFNERASGGSGAIYPTPTIGMVGVIDDVDRVVEGGFRNEGDAIILLGRNTDELGGSEYLKVVHGKVAGNAPAIDLAGERALQEAMLELAGAGLARSAQDCSEGGLAVALAESVLASPDRYGITVELGDELDATPLLFGEGQGRIVVSCAADQADEVLATAARHGVPATLIGTVGEAGGSFRITLTGPNAGTGIDLPVSELAESYFGAIPSLMEGTGQ